MIKPILCIGGANIDKKLRMAQPLQYATSNPVISNTSFGGVARNVAENLAHWTTGIHLQSAVGNDAEGKRLLSYLKNLSIQIDSCFTIDHLTTANYYALLKPDGELDFAFADMDIYDHISLSYFKDHWQQHQDKSIIFLDTNFPHAILEYVLRESKNRMLCIDPVSIEKAKKLPSLLEHVFFIKPNQFEIQALTDIQITSLSDCRSAAWHLLDRGVKNVILTLGEKGYVLINDKQTHHVEAHTVKQIHDVNGAGDAFVAGILFGLQQDYDLVEACRFGAKAATFTLQSSQTVAKKFKLS